MSKKLELIWEGKETPLRPEPRILTENHELSYLKQSGKRCRSYADELRAAF